MNRLLLISLSKCSLLTFHQTSWGSRPDGDANDASRMIPHPSMSDSIVTPLPRPDDLDRIINGKQRHTVHRLSEKRALAISEAEVRSIAVIAGYT